MSRILRRPMFRGGRVDSRGTGITSGLKYKQGGQVQPLLAGQHPEEFKDAEGREQHWAVLGYVPQALSAMRAFGPAAYRGWKASRAYTPWSKDLGKWGRVKDFFKPKSGMKLRSGAYEKTLPGQGAGFRTGSYIRQNPMTTLALGPQVVDKGYKGAEWAATEGLPAVGRTTADVLWPDDWPTWNPFKKKEEEPPEETPIDPEIAALQKTIEERDAFIKFLEEQARVKKNKKLTKEEKVAKIKENEEMFREVYGSGRGEDATNMLLSFAGKALKPGATTKSAFGEFFEEESKRPSERKKYKDAAAQAAIQSFLTGEKTMADLDAWMKKTTAAERAKYNIAQEMSDARSWPTRVAESGKKNYTSPRKMFIAELPDYLADIKQPYTSIEFADEEDVDVTSEKAQENVGKVFVDLETGVFFIVEIGSDGKLKKKYLHR